MSQEPVKSRKAIWREPPFLVGVALTLLVCGVFAYSLWCLPVVDTDGSYFTKWSYLKDAAPNEIGDTLAGVAGSLAFVWLVVTVWLQATELREQRNEFEKMAEAQEKQVDLLTLQGKIFEDEQRQREEERAKLLLNERLKTLRAELDRLQYRWTFDEMNKSRENRGCSVWPFGASGTPKELSLEEVLGRFCSSMSRGLEEIETGSNYPGINSAPNRENWQGVCDKLSEISGSKAELSDADQEFVRRINIEGLLGVFQRYLNANIWEGDA
ncbi:hypothetical protein [Thalassovita sp.]|jgi:hypothetical protein|uniref:hypothetical protein n=1 Tax=Thalassovita sp. TaxID=1979401 RepID=UPI003B5A6583